MASPPPTPAPETQVHTVAIALALLSLLLILLITPPLIWHARNRNPGATSLIAWTLLVLGFTTLNALIWPSDDISGWFSGVGLCDVEVRLQVASQVAVPASFAAVLRGLAKVLDTENVTLGTTKAQRRRNLLLDLLFCVGAPVVQTGLFEVVHAKRYSIYGIAGCTPAVSASWVMVLLLVVPPLLWTVLDAFYAVLILTRLYRYRLQFHTLLAHSRTTKSRFLRLYLLCSTWLLASLPLALYTLATNARTATAPYSWKYTHDHAAYHDVFLVPSGGAVLWDRWVWVATGGAVFAFFGWGREAVGMYSAALLSLGLGRIFPGSHKDSSSSPSSWRSRRGTATTIGSVSSRARLLFGRKSTSSQTSKTSAWASNASTLRGDSQSDDPPISPKTATFSHTIGETPPSSASRAADLEKGLPAQTPPSPSSKPSLLDRIHAFFRGTNLPARQRGSAPVPLAELSNANGTVKATVVAGPRQRPESFARHVRDQSTDVVVRKEVRWGSE